MRTIEDRRGPQPQPIDPKVIQVASKETEAIASLPSLATTLLLADALVVLLRFLFLGKEEI